MFAQGEDQQQSILQQHSLIQQLLAMSAATSSPSAPTAPCGSSQFVAQAVLGFPLGQQVFGFPMAQAVVSRPAEIPWYKKPRTEQTQTSKYGPYLEFGIRGDSLMNTRAETKKKSYKTFKGEFETEFWNSFGACSLDYKLSPGLMVRDVTDFIKVGPSFDILCVGIGINDLLLLNENNIVVGSYPRSLDDDLRDLAVAIRSKSGRSLVLVGGPASVWKYPKHWDTFIEHAIETLVDAGVQVVPFEDAATVMQRMPVSRDGLHFANNEHSKTLFAKEWASWLTTHVDMQGAHAAKSRKSDSTQRNRSRSR
jgi:hypothetical protein